MVSSQTSDVKEMYTIKPINKNFTDVPLPDCMYTIDNLHSINQNMTIAAPNGDACPVETGNPEMDALARHQFGILKNLDKLKEEVEKLAKKLNYTLGSQTSIESDEVPSKKRKRVEPPKLEDGIMDFIISVSPDKYSVSPVILACILKNRGIDVTTPAHCHSSLAAPLPDNLKQITNGVHGSVKVDRRNNKRLVEDTDTNTLKDRSTNMGFGNLKTDAGLRALNEFLAEKSYIDGYVPTTADVALFGQLASAPKSFPHALRWYKHLASFSAGERASFAASNTIAAPAPAPASEQKQAGRGKALFTYIWKNEAFLPMLIYKPCLHTKIYGDVNIARFLSRVFAPDLYADQDMEVTTSIDKWLDLANQMNHGNKKDQESVVKSMNQYLGKHEYLASDEATLADVVLLSALKMNPSLTTMPSINSWIERVSGDFNL